MALRIGDIVANIKANTSDFKSGITEAKTITEQFTSGITKSSFLIAGALTAVAGVGLTVAKSAVEQADAYEQSQIAFETMLGSGDLAKQLLADLADFAKKTPFELQGIEANARQLIAMGAGMDDVLPELKMMGDLSAGLSIPMERLTYNYGQVRAQNKLTGREMRDFAMAGVPLLEELANMFGVTKEEVQEMVSDSEVGFEDVRQAFANMTGEGGKFFNLMEKQSASFTGQVSNLKDEWSLFLREIGGELLPFAKQAVAFLRDEALPAFKNLIEFLRNNRNVVIGIAVAIGVMLVPAIYALLTSLGVAMAVFIAANAVLIAIGVAIGALVYLVLEHWDEIVAFFQETTQKIVAWFQQTKESITNWLSETWTTIVETLKNVGQKIYEFVDFITKPFQLWASAWLWVWDNLIYPLLFLIFAIVTRIFYEIGKVVSDAMDWVLNNVIIPIWNAIHDWIKVRLDAIKLIIDIVMAFISMIAKKKMQEFHDNTITPIQNAYQMIKFIGGIIKDFIVSWLQGLVDDAIAWGKNMIEAIVSPFRKAKEEIEKVAEDIKELARKISPFHKESPSLVELVTKGVDEIKKQYASLGSDLNVPNVAHAGQQLGTGQQVVQNITVYPADSLDIETIADKLAFMYRTQL